MFQIDEEYLRDTLKEPFFRCNITVGDNRHLLFATDYQLELLAKTRTWYIDGTFKVVKDTSYYNFKDSSSMMIVSRSTV